MLYPVAGTVVEIGGVIAVPSGADLTDTDFTSQTWTPIEPLEQIGTIGDTSEEITFGGIGNARKYKLKGPRDAGNMELVAGIDYADAGQIALIAAEKTNNAYAFRVTFPDKPSTGTAPAASTRMFAGLVMSAAEALTGASDVAKMNVTVGITSNIVRTDATTGD